MNEKQKVLLIVVSCVLLLMLLFPPWYLHALNITIHKGYHFIIDSQNPDLRSCTINVGLLMMQYLFTLTIGGIFYFILRDKDRGDKDQK